MTVVVATTGEASHPDSPTTGPAELAAVRRVEVRAAVARLAPRARVVQLDLDDGGLAQRVDVLAAELRTLMGDGDQRTWIVAPWREDRHPDHAAASEAAAQVAVATGARLLEYPLWAWHWARPGDGVFEAQRLVALDVPGFAATAKGRALAEHHSQIEPLSPAPGDEPVVSSAFREHFVRDREVFVDASPWQPPAGFLRRVLRRRHRSLGFSHPMVRKAEAGHHSRQPAPGAVRLGLRTRLRHRRSHRGTGVRGVTICSRRTSRRHR